MFVVFKSALEKIDFILKGMSIFFFFYLTNIILAGVLLHIMFMFLFLEPMEKTINRELCSTDIVFKFYMVSFLFIKGQFCLSVS